MTVYGEIAYVFYLPQDYGEMKQFEAENDLSIYRRTEDTIAVRYNHKVNATYPYKSKADRKDEPTISKMEQVEDEPKTQMKTQNSNLTFKTLEYCDICDHKGCEGCIANALDEHCMPSNFEEAVKDKPQLKEDGELEILTQTIEFPDTHQKFVFARKIEMDGDSIKICGWEYKGVKDGEREGE